MDLDDEFSIEPTPNEEVLKPTQAKSMKALYQALAAKPHPEAQGKKKSKKEEAAKEEVQSVKPKKEKKSKVGSKAIQQVKETAKQVKEEKQVKKEKKEKKQEKEKAGKGRKQEQESSAAEKQKKIYKRKVDTSFKYVKNKTLETQLKEKALQGVLRILNMISKTQAERNVE